MVADPRRVGRPSGDAGTGAAPASEKAGETERERDEPAERGEREPAGRGEASASREEVREGARGRGNVREGEGG